MENKMDQAICALLGLVVGAGIAMAGLYLGARWRNRA